MGKKRGLNKMILVENLEGRGLLEGQDLDGKSATLK